MRNLLVAGLISISSFFATAKATDWATIDDVKSFSPRWEINNSRPNTTVDVFRFNNNGRVGGLGSCGLQATAFYRLAMMLNKDTLQDIINNWQNLAFIGALYIAGSYFPILKEAMVGAEMIANGIARLRNVNCDSAAKEMNNYLRETSDLVRACVLKRIGMNASPFSLDTASIQSYIESNNIQEKKIQEAYAFCMNNATVFDAFNIGSQDLGKWLDRFNLRKKMFCGMVNTLGMQDFGDRYSYSSSLINGSDVKTMAQLVLISITPEWIIDQKDKDILVRKKAVYYTDSKGNSIQVDSSTMPYMLRDIVDKEFEGMINDLNNGNYKGFYQKADSLITRYNLNKDKVMPYFDFMYLSTLYQKKFEKEDKIRYVKLKNVYDDYVKSLKFSFIDMMQTQIVNEMGKQWEKAKDMYEAKKAAGARDEDIQSYCNNPNVASASN